MHQFKTIQIEQTKHLATIWLNRPDRRNAFNEVMIEELIHAFEYLENDEEVRIILLRGKGKVFCAGADLNWMKAVAKYDREENYKESLNLSKCFHTIYSSLKPTIAIVQGAAIGGANGLLAACDVVLAEEDAVFSLSEVKIGIVPACIAPYLLKRMGEFSARELMLTGKRIQACEAQDKGLINYALNKNELQEKLDDLIRHILQAGPKAVHLCKQLIDSVANHWSMEEAYSKTAELIADIRISEEGQEGMSAFLEKRSPNWISDQDIKNKLK